MQTNDLLGWRNTFWGMTTQEVLATVQTEYRCTQTKEEVKGLLGLIRIPVVSILSEEFEVLFLFGRNTLVLTEVLLRASRNWAENRKAPFVAAKKLLNEIYGSSVHDGTEEAFIWQFPTTTVRLVYIEIDDLESFTAIRFQPTAYFQRTTSPPAF